MFFTFFFAPVWWFLWFFWVSQNTNKKGTSDLQPASFLSFHASRMRFTSLQPRSSPRESPRGKCSCQSRNPHTWGTSPWFLTFKMYETPLFLPFFPVICRKVSMMVHMGGSVNGGTPKWMVYNGKSHWNGWWLGVPPILGNLHSIYSYHLIPKSS